MIGAVIAQIARALGASVDPDDVRDVACDVTASDDVCDPAPVETPEPPSLSAGDPGFGGAFGTLLVLVLVLALAAGIVWLIVRLVRDRIDTGEANESDELDEDVDEPVERRVVDHVRPPDRWREAAARHRAAGEYRDAIRCEYRALVGDLARAGVVDEIPGRTSGEERAQIADLAPGVAAEFSTTADLFDQAWFDHDVVTGADDERFRVAEGVVLDAVAPRRPR